MIAIFGEDKSDAETVKAIIVAMCQNPALSIKPVGFDGGPELLKHGEREARALKGKGYTTFVVCYDSDGRSPAACEELVHSKIIRPAGIAASCCVVVPVHEIESWILADLPAVTNVFSSWKPDPHHGNPESLQSPKEHIERLSKATGRRPNYSHATHNKLVAKHLNFETVATRCPSFRPLRDFALSLC